MKVLFIGNSYTYFNDLPAMFAEICAAHGVTAEVDSVTRGGYTLRHYLTEGNEKAAEAESKLSENKYDYVVLQEQSVRPAKDPEQFLSAAALLCERIRKNGAVPVFYQTWGRRDDSKVLEENGWTHEQMQDLLRGAYEKAAKDNCAVLVYAGDAFHRAYRGEQGSSVYADDGTHPSAIGTRVVAEEFYNVLAKK